MVPQEQGILVVDDAPARRARIARLLAAEDFAVATAAEGLSALRLVGERRFALIVAAMRLPGSLDGIATVRQARARQPWLKALYTEDYGRRPGFGLRDREDLIVAPFERWELLGCVFELLQRAPMDTAADLASRVRVDRRAS